MKPCRASQTISWSMPTRHQSQHQRSFRWWMAGSSPSRVPEVIFLCCGDWSCVARYRIEWRDWQFLSSCQSMLWDARIKPPDNCPSRDSDLAKLSDIQSACYHSNCVRHHGNWCHGNCAITAIAIAEDLVLQRGILSKQSSKQHIPQVALSQRRKARETQIRLQMHERLDSRCMNAQRISSVKFSAQHTNLSFAFSFCNPARPAPLLHGTKRTWSLS